MCKRDTFQCQKCAFASRRGVLSILGGAVMGYRASFRDRGAALLAAGVPYLLRMALSWAKRTPFYQKSASAGGKAPI